MRTVIVEVTTIADGSGSAFGDSVVGILYAAEYQPGSIATGATITLTCESDSTKPLLTKANAGTANAWFYPRDLVHAVADGAALTGTSGGDRVAPVLHGRLKVAIASGGDTKTGKVIFYVE
jgi:hypothetical protein